MPDSWRVPGCFYGCDALVALCRGCARKLGRFVARMGTWRGCPSADVCSAFIACAVELLVFISQNSTYYFPNASQFTPC